MKKSSVISFTVGATCAVAVAMLGSGMVSAQTDVPLAERDTSNAVVDVAPPIVRPAEDGPATPAAAGVPELSPADGIFRPIAPCRIADTRYAGGIIVPGAPRDFIASGIAGNDYSSQGGTTCNIPISATAIHVNIGTTGQTNNGYLKAYPYLATPPNASILNYRTGVAIANAATLKICGKACSRDLTFSAHTGSTHVFLDVLGYYEPPLTAEVNWDGTFLQASYGVSTVAKYGTGFYYVTFDRDVMDCAISATAGTTDPGPVLPPPVVPAIADRPAGGVYVDVRDFAGDYVNGPFTLTAVC